MKITLKLKIDASPEDLAALRETGRQYTGSFNRIAAAGWGMHRINGVELHHATYRAERENTNLPSDVICAARVKATEALKSAFALRKKGGKVNCPRSAKCPIRYNAKSATIHLHLSKASLSTVSGRKVVDLIIPPYHQSKINGKVCSSDLCESRDGRMYLHVVIERPTPEFRANGRVVGVDLGINRPLVTSDCGFLGEGRWADVNGRFSRLRRALQSKDTRSARRHLGRLRGRENRFRSDCDHVLSRRVVDSAGVGTTIAIEDLTDIRRKRMHKDQRRRLHSWSFRRLRAFLEYKAEACGGRVVVVDARYTSQKCSACGHISKSNRPTQSQFACRGCGFRLDADLNAARNIRGNYMVSAGMTGEIGLMSTSPSLSGSDSG